MIDLLERTSLLAISSRLLVVVSLFLLLRSLSRTPYLHAMVWLPSTIAHELAHFLLGVLFRAHPVRLSLWPRRIPGTDRYVLGHVAFSRLTWWNKLPVSTAPLLLAPLGVWLLGASLPYPGMSLVALLYCFLAVQCFAGSWPSPEDWAHARSAILVLLSLAAVFSVGYIVLSA